MDTLLRKAINAVVNSRFPETSIGGCRQIESVLVHEEYPKEVIAPNEGGVAHELVFVGKGMPQQYYYKSGRDVTEYFLYEGCILICIGSLLRQVPTRLIIETLEPAVIYLLPYDKMVRLTRQDWEINMFYRKILECSPIVPQAKTDSWRSESARERYNLLLETCPETVERAPLVHITSYLLMTPETLNRVRSGVLQFFNFGSYLLFRYSLGDIPV